MLSNKEQRYGSQEETKKEVRQRRRLSRQKKKDCLRIDYIKKFGIFQR